MRSIAKVVGRLRQVPRLTKVLGESRGLINTTDLLVATAATVILSAAIGGAAISTLNDSKYGKAQPDAQTLAQAITTFYKDTGKWPGQAEQTTTTGAKVVLLATGSGTYASTTFHLPQVASDGLRQEGVTCANNSLEGFVQLSVPGFVSTTGAVTIDGKALVLNLNDYLVRKPTDPSYTSWKGPYVQEISDDAWGRAWVAYLAPLYCSEEVTGTTGASGSIGYGWLLSGGSNRTITTNATDFTLDPTGDDTGVILGKLVVRAAPVSQ